MAPLGNIIILMAYVALVATAASAAIAAIRYRDRHQADVLATVVSLAVLAVVSKPVRFDSGRGYLAPLWMFVAMAQPYLLVRLVHHFGSAPRVLRTGVAVITLAGTAFLFLLPRPHPPIVFVLTSVYFLTVLSYAACAFTIEALRNTGVTGWRLKLTASGMWLLGFLLVVNEFAKSMPEVHISSAVKSLIGVLVVFCYCFGLAAPRPLRRLWQRGELFRYLRETAERDPAEREHHATEDLCGAAVRGVAAAAGAVLIGSHRLVVQTASQQAWRGLSLAPDATLLGTVCGTLTPATGSPAECGPELAERLTPIGRQVLAVPIAARSRCWGVLIVVQRYGSLFLEDDTALLTRLCRYTADTLDHARLLSEERDRQQRRADARVRESESRLELMLESIRDYAMVTLDDSGRITSWNVGAEQVFGYQHRETVGQSASRLFDDTDRATEFITNLVNARRGDRVYREGLCRRRDGTTFIGSTVIRALRHDGDHAEGFVLVTRDVTEQRQLEDRLRQGQKMEAIGRLAGGVAHDFNNLLTVIMGYAATLELSLPEQDEEHRAEVVEIRRAAERASALTRQLLTFSRQQVLQPRVVRLPEIVSGLLPMLSRVLGEQVEVIDTSEAGVRPVMADSGEMEQVIINLAVNARDAMPSGGRLTIRTSSIVVSESRPAMHLDAKPGPYTLLEVIDTGVGMDNATRTRIFEPFFTTKEFGRGTGLGLATVYGIVKQLGGGIEVASQPGRGTTMRVYLQPSDEEPAAHAAPPVPASAAARGWETILLVEDEASVRGLVAAQLSRDGYRVLIAENPAAAIALVDAETGEIHLVVTDVVMPGSSGPDLVKKLVETRPRMRALFISGYAETALVRQDASTLSKVALHFLQKPFTSAQLLVKVREILNAADAT